MNQKDLERLRGFRLMDDDFLRMCLNDNVAAAELIVRIVLGRNDLKVIQSVGQKELKNQNPFGHSVTLDILAEDSSGKKYDIEIQRKSRGANPRRARFHSSMVDAGMLQQGEEYIKLKDSYVIFITEKDFFKENCPCYHIVRIIKENGQIFKDGSHIIYVNGMNVNTRTKLGRLLHDFNCMNADDMYFPVLADAVRYFKEEGGVREMCEMMEEMRKEAAREAARKARKRAKAAARKEIAKAKAEAEREKARAKEEAEREKEEAVAKTAVETYREMELPDTEILRRIMKRFDLSQEIAESYLGGVMIA